MSLVNYLDVYQDFLNSTEAVTKHHTTCANCGVAKTDDIKLIPCRACDLKSYCSDECMTTHREAHDAECRVRSLEIFEDMLFKQPEGSHLGDCPICFLPMPIDPRRYKKAYCCGKVICKGCFDCNRVRECHQRLVRRCVFCRKIHPKSVKEVNEYVEGRAEKNDPVALQQLGEAKHGEGKYEEAAFYYLKAAEFGDVESRFRLANMYGSGEGVQENFKEMFQYLVEAALCGHPLARNNIGVLEIGTGNYDKAVKHFIMAATLGCDKSLDALKDLYKDGHASKEDYAGALRAHQAAVDETKSSMRDTAGVEDLPVYDEVAEMVDMLFPGLFDD